jgi:signal transduction histidine kinase
MTNAFKSGERMNWGSWPTRFNQMAEKLHQVEAMRRQLIGDVSHELRTPLTAIKGSMEGLMDGVLPATDETYQQIHQEADRLNRLVDDLQELSRVESGAYELDLRRTQIAPLLETLTKRFRQQFGDQTRRTRPGPASRLAAYPGRRAPHPAGADQPDRQRVAIYARRRDRLHQRRAYEWNDPDHGP